MATKTKSKLSFEVACPKCGATQGPPVIGLNLNDLDGPLTCSECSDEFTVAEAVEHFGRICRSWQMVEAMVEHARTMLATDTRPYFAETI